MEQNFILKNPSVKIALIGNPNCGKSTLFNSLTGLKQNTGNFPGVTVEKKTGKANLFSIHLNKNISAEIIDLPGAYSLNTKSLDEKIAAELLTDKSHPDSPDIIIYIADATNLKRSLFFATQVIELGKPMILALNMMDLADEKGIGINVDLLSLKMGVKIIPISARKNVGIDKIKEAIVNDLPIVRKTFVEATSDAAKETIERYRIITEILNQCVVASPASKNSFTKRLDQILTHKIWGYAIFLFILFLIFESIFFISAYPMEWIENLFTLLSRWSSDSLPKGELTDLFVNGILAGLSGVVVFIPQIAMLFFFIAILEDTGYMARVSFIMDKLMRKFGLSGRSVIPLIGGFACAVPAIMTARTISNWKERLITIFITPLMSCSARLPVFTLLISLVVPSKIYFGFLNVQGIVLMGLYLIGFLAGIFSAFVMKFLIKAKEKSYFIMEMPDYRSPRWSNVGLMIFEKVKVFCFDAGKVILAVSVILWALAAHAPGNSFTEIDKKYSDAIANSKAPIVFNMDVLESQKASEKLEASYAGIIGKKIEPLISPLGFNWKIGIALVTSFAAREVFVGTMATIYSVGDANNSQSIREKMREEINPVTGEKVYSLAVGFSLMIFYAFALQCMSTIAVVYRETKNWKWPLIQFIYMGVLAYIASFIVYQLLK